MPVRSCTLLLAAAASLGLAGCERGADSGATANPNAPGRPGTGNPTEVVVPASPGGAPHAGSSGGDAAPGASGAGAVGQVPPADGGLQGGMGAGPASAPAGSASAPPGTMPEGNSDGAGRR